MRNRTAAQIQKENLYGVGEVRLFSVGFQQFIYNISKKRDAKKLNRVFSHPLLFHIYHIINRLYTLQPAFITLSKIFNTDLFYLYACNVGVVRILSGVSTPSAVVTVYFITCGEPASTTRSTL